MPSQILIVALGADHGAVVAAQLQRRQVQPDARLVAGALQVSPDDGVGRYAAGGTEDLPPGPGAPPPAVRDGPDSPPPS